MANKIYIQLEVDDKGTAVVRRFDKETEQAFDKMRRDADKASTGMGGSLQKLKQHWIAVSAAIAGVVLGIKDFVTKASNLQETTSKFNVVFADQIELAQQWSKALVDGYAMSTRESKQYLSSIQDLLVPMGMQRDLAGQLSFEITKLAADLGSFNNLPTAQVMGDIQSALVGNYETMKKYGVVINATMVQEQALAMGLARTKDELTTAQKAYAAYTMIVEDSEAAVGDMARTQDDYANTLKRYKAATEDLAASLGTKLLPVLTDVFNLLGDVVRKWDEWVKSSKKVVAPMSEQLEKKWMEELEDWKAKLKMALEEPEYFKFVFGELDLAEAHAQIKSLQDRLAFLRAGMREAAGGTAGAGAGGAPPPPGGGGLDTAMLERYKEVMKGSAKEIGAEWQLVNQVTADHRGEIMLMEQAYREGLDTELLERYKEVMQETGESARTEWELINEVTAAHRGEIMMMQQAYEENAASAQKSFEIQKTLADATARSMQATFSNVFFDAFTGKLKTLDDYWHAFCNAMLKAFADMLAAMLVKWLFFQLATAGAGGGGGGFFGIFHQGGIVGETAVPKRFVPLQPARPIPRLHGGLRSDEYPVILQKGETVIPADEAYGAEDMPILQIVNNIDGRTVSKAVIRRTEIDAIILNRLKKALS